MRAIYRKAGMLVALSAALISPATFGQLPSAPVAGSSGEPVSEFATAAELGLMQGFPPPPGKRVDRSNAIFDPPFIRWSYLNMRSIYPSAPIAPAATAIPVRRDIDRAIAGLSVEKPESGQTVDMDTYLQETFTDALVVIHGDRIVFERYLNGMHADQPHQMMSVTKSFAGLLALMAVEDGLLEESDPVVKHVPELKASGAFWEATLGQVLDMTNSMRFSEDYADPASDIVEYTVVLGLNEPEPGRNYADNIYDYLVTLDADPEHRNGEIFHYQTPKTDVVNWVTNRVTGQSFQQAMYERLWSKLGTEGETYVLLDTQGTLFAGGGLNASPNNLARFAIMLLNNGKFNGQQVVSPAIIETLAAGADREAYATGMGLEPDSRDGSYRAQWWIRHTPGHEALMALGIHGQWIYVDVERDVAFIKQSSQPVSDDLFYDLYNLSAFDTIIAHLTRVAPAQEKM